MVISLEEAVMQTYDLYVDGSEHLGRVGFGWLVLANGSELKRGSGPVPPDQVEGSRQVAGELMAVGHALCWCREQGIDHVRLHYDYVGIEYWATGRWKAKKGITQRYAAFMQQIGIQVEFVKVKSHSGNPWNDVVDGLARAAAQAQQANSDPFTRLKQLTPLWIAWLKDNGYDEVAFLGFFNHMYARFEVRREGKRLALLDLYDTPKKPLNLYIHACSDAAQKANLQKVWSKVRPQYLKLPS
jgi:ribonuclease HI